MQPYYSKNAIETKEMLKQVSKHKYILLSLEDRYSKLYSESKAKGQEITGMPFCSHYKTDKIGDYNIELVSLEELILEERCKLLEAHRKAKQFINKVADPVIIDIMYNKYIRCKDENEVAAIVKLSMKAVDKILNTFFQTDVNYI